MGMGMGMGMGGGMAEATGGGVSGEISAQRKKSSKFTETY